jgi:hypothetical protein
LRFVAHAHAHVNEHEHEHEHEHAGTSAHLQVVTVDGDGVLISFLLFTGAKRQPFEGKRARRLVNAIRHAETQDVRPLRPRLVNMKSGGKSSIRRREHDSARSIARLA